MFTDNSINAIKKSDLYDIFSYMVNKYMKHFN